MGNTVHKERRERIQDKNLIIQKLNERIAFLNQELLALRLVSTCPPVFSVIEDRGSYLQQKTIIRQSLVPGGYEIFII